MAIVSECLLKLAVNIYLLKTSYFLSKKYSCTAVKTNLLFRMFLKIQTLKQYFVILKMTRRRLCSRAQLYLGKEGAAAVPDAGRAAGLLGTHHPGAQVSLRVEATGSLQTG